MAPLTILLQKFSTRKVIVLKLTFGQWVASCKIKFLYIFIIYNLPFYITFRYTLLVGSHPFETQSFKDTFSKIKQNDYHIPSQIGPLARALITRMLQDDPACRYNRFKSVRAMDLKSFTYWRHLIYLDLQSISFWMTNSWHVVICQQPCLYPASPWLQDSMPSWTAALLLLVVKVTYWVKWTEFICLGLLNIHKVLLTPTHNTL